MILCFVPICLNTHHHPDSANLVGVVVYFISQVTIKKYIFTKQARWWISIKHIAIYF